MVECSNLPINGHNNINGIISYEMTIQKIFIYENIYKTLDFQKIFSKFEYSVIWYCKMRGFIEIHKQKLFSGLSDFSNSHTSKFRQTCMHVFNFLPHSPKAWQPSTLSICLCTLVCFIWKTRNFLWIKHIRKANHLLKPE